MTVGGRGAEWGKWDLHVHTPASLVHRYKGGDDAWPRFLDELENLPPEFSVLGINDYWFLDGYRRILAERAAGRLSNIAEVFPVVEMRLDQFGGSTSKLRRANLHVIFDPKLDPDVIQSQFLNAMTPKFHLSDPTNDFWSGTIDRASLTELGRKIKASVPDDQVANYAGDLEEGFNNLVVSLDSVEKILSGSFFQNKAILALGKTEWADIKWQDGAVASKKHLVNSVGLLFTAFADAQDWAGQRQALKGQGVPDYLIDCSDAHTWSDNHADKDRLGNCATWMRAAPSFAGLLHALSEFDQRVYVGTEPEDLARRRRAPDRIVDRVSVRSTGPTPGGLFDYEVPVNQGLVAIIGNKGQGKSALLDCVARAGNSSRDREFGFLNSTRFLNPKNPARMDYAAELEWADGTIRPVGLHEGHDSASLERVEYLPQRLIERICSSDPNSEQRGAFEAELTRVLFHHIPPVERQAQNSLRDLLTLKTSAVDVEIAELRRRLRDRCVQYVDLQKSASVLVLPDLVARREALLNLKARAVQARVEAEQVNAELDAATVGTDPLAADRVRLAELRGEVLRLDEAHELASRDAAAKARVLSESDALVVELQALQNRVQEVAARLSESLGIDARLAELQVDRDAISRRQEEFRAERQAKVEVLRGVEASAQAILLEQVEVEARLGRSSSERDAARRILDQTVARIRAIEGAEDEPDTIAYVDKQIADARLLPDRLNATREALVQGVREAHGLLRKRLSVIEELYAPAANFVSTSELAQEAGLEFVSDFFAAPSWSRFANELDGRRSAELTIFLGTALDAVSLDDEDDVVALVVGVIERLSRQRGAAGDPARSLAEAFRINTDVVDYLLDLVCLSWVRDQFSLRGRGLALDQLSPGERGLILLLFYLVVDREDIPLLLDQPEENLDNSAVRRVLVPALHDARMRRQVLMVTHNANLAVVGDADQIIHCTFNEGRFALESGSLAEAATGAYSIDVLEGARPAFENRRLKYESVVPQA